MQILLTNFRLNLGVNLTESRNKRLCLVSFTLKEAAPNSMGQAILGSRHKRIDATPGNGCFDRFAKGVKKAEHKISVFPCSHLEMSFDKRPIDRFAIDGRFLVVELSANQFPAGVLVTGC